MKFSHLKIKLVIFGAIFIIFCHYSIEQAQLAPDLVPLSRTSQVRALYCPTLLKSTATLYFIKSKRDCSSLYVYKFSGHPIKTQGCIFFNFWTRVSSILTLVLETTLYYYSILKQFLLGKRANIVFNVRIPQKVTRPCWISNAYLFGKKENHCVSSQSVSKLFCQLMSSRTCLCVLASETNS